MAIIVQKPQKYLQKSGLTPASGNLPPPGRPTVELTPLIGPWLVRLGGLGLVALIGLIVQTNLARWQAETLTAHPTPAPWLAPDGPDYPVKAPNFGETRLPSSQLISENSAPPEISITYEQMFRDIAPRYGLDWRLLAQLAYHESRFNRLAIGRHNDLGLMQILPSTWNEWAPRVGVTDPFDPYSNIEVAAAYLAYLRDYARVRGYNDPQWMLIGYNWGPDNLRQLFAINGTWEQVPEKQRHYVLSILQAGSSDPAAGMKRLN